MQISTYIFPGFSGNDWITLRESNGTKWSVLSRIKTTTRTDTHAINTSPITSMTPVTRLIQGCNYTINIPGILFISFKMSLSPFNQNQKELDFHAESAASIIIKFASCDTNRNAASLSL